MPYNPLMHHVYAGKGGEQEQFFLFPNINPIDPIKTKLNQEVSSSWAYLPYSRRIMCMPRDMERKGNAKRFNNPTAIYKPP